MSTHKTPSRPNRRRPRPKLERTDARPLDVLAWLFLDVRNAATAILLLFGVSLAIAVPIVTIGLVFRSQPTVIQLLVGALVAGGTGGGSLLARNWWRERKARSDAEAGNGDRPEEPGGQDESAG